MSIRYLILGVISFVLLQGTALAKTQVGEEPFSIDGYDNEWKSVSEDKTDFYFADLGINVSLGLQRESYSNYPYNSRLENDWFDAVRVSYNSKRSHGFKLKDMRFTIQYADPRDGHIIDSSYNNSAKMTVDVQSRPDMVATGDVYKQAFSNEDGVHVLEFLFDRRLVSAGAIPILTISMNEQEGSHVLKEVFDSAKKPSMLVDRHLNPDEVRAMSSWFGDGEGYSITITATGTIGPVVKGFEASFNTQEYSVSVVDGFQAGEIASAQVEVGIWNSGDLDKIASGVTVNAAMRTPIVEAGLLSNQDGTVRGVGVSWGPSLALGIQVSRLKAEELHRGAYWGYDPERMDPRDRTRDELDEDRDSNTRDRGDNEHDNGDHDERGGGSFALEYDYKTRETTRVDFKDDPADPDSVGD
ncbi:TPA: hypothetical protein ACRZZH_002784 [Vibrio harveyi]